MDNIISSDWLYHYTRNIENLKGILLNGFRYSRLEELIPYRANSYQASYAVCFCDLTMANASQHRASYGNIAIALSKDWGIKNKISPVRYAHRLSPGNDINYRLFKTLKYDFDEYYGHNAYRNVALTALVRYVRDYIDNGNEITLPFPAETIISRKYLDELVEIFGDENDNKVAAIFRHTFEALHFYIQTLHNELEILDRFMRVYEEEIEKKLIRRYDEREWRASFSPTQEQSERLNLTKYFLVEL